LTSSPNAVAQQFVATQVHDDVQEVEADPEANRDFASLLLVARVSLV
jgi:hypothetical protein